jgi:CRP-like cAMP-binding protein
MEQETKSFLKKYKPEQILFREGAASNSVFIVQKGAVSIQVRKGDLFVEVAKIPPGEVIGELTFFDRSLRSATAVAVGEVEVLEVPFDSLEKAYQSIPEIMKIFVATLAERLRKLNEEVKQLREAHVWGQQTQKK